MSKKKNYFVDDLPDDQYHSLDSLSSSGARKLLDCPAKYWYERNNPPPVSSVFNFGHAAHSVILGAGRPLKKLDYDNMRTTKARTQHAEFLKNGFIPVLPDQMKQVEDMAAAVSKHPAAANLLSAPGGVPERSFFWEDEHTGMNLRARPDLTIEKMDSVLLVDYKTTVDASLAGFERSIGKFGYHMQAAWYATGFRRTNWDPDVPIKFIFIAQEKTAPYLVNVIELDEFSMSAGEEANRRAIEIFAECSERGIWPGYGNEIKIGSVPVWAADLGGLDNDW